MIFTPDEIDVKILEVLQQEARISMLELADRVGLSPTPCARRVKEMEKSGLIRGYVALIDRHSVGLSTEAVVRVRLRHPAKEATTFEQTLGGMPEVLRCARVTGVYDYILSVIAPDTESLGLWMREKLLCLPAVIQTDTSVVIGLIKSGGTVPLLQAGKFARYEGTGARYERIKRSWSRQ